MRAMIIGVTGLVGSHLYEELLKDPLYDEVITLSRRDLEGHPKVKHLKVSFDDLEEVSSSFNVDVIFCALGTTIHKAGSKEAFVKIDHEYPLKFAKLLKEINPEGLFIIVTAMGADENSNIFYNKVKGELEASLINLDLKHLVIVRPSLIIGRRQELRPVEAIGQFFAKALEPLLGRVLPRIAGVSAQKIARSMIKAALKSEAKVRVILSYEIRKGS